MAFVASLMFCLPVFAQIEVVGTDNQAITVVSVETSSVTAVATITKEENKEIISSWKLLWQGIKEQISLLITLDPVAKAEKLTAYSQQRMEMAQSFAQQAEDNPVLQKKAEQMMKKAEKFMQQLMDKKEKIAEKQTERAQKALRQAAEQALGRQEIINKLEENLSPESMQRLEEMRTRGLENSQRLINAIGNENISSSTKAHLEEVKAKIEAHLLEVKTFMEEKKALLLKAQSGDKEAMEELKNGRQERIQNREDNKNEVKALMQEKKEVRNEIKSEVKEVKRENRSVTNTI